MIAFLRRSFAVTPVIMAFAIGAHSMGAESLINYTSWDSPPWNPSPWHLYTHGSGQLREVVHETAIARRGGGSVKFVMDRTYGGTFWRSQVRYPRRANPFSSNLDERWIGFSTYVADSGPDEWTQDTEDEIIFQLWNNTHTPPLLGIWFTRNDEMQVRYRACSFDPRKHSDTKNDSAFIGKIAPTRGRWLDWVMRIKLSHSSPDGILEVWTRLETEANYKKVVDRHKIEIGYNAPHPPDIDVGLYKWSWKDRNAGVVNRRVIWFDEFRLGDENSSFAEVALPDGGNRPPVENAQGVITPAE